MVKSMPLVNHQIVDRDKTALSGDDDGCEVGPHISENIGFIILLHQKLILTLRF